MVDEGFKKVGNSTVRKLRACISPGASNSVVWLLGKTCMMGLDGFISLLQAFRTVLGPVVVHFVKEDWSKGFQQLLMSPESSKLYCVVAMDPSTGQPWIWRPRTLKFGPRAAPAQFCRTSAGVIAILQSLFLVACDVHVDDEVIVEEPWAMESASECVQALHGALAINLDASKAVPDRLQVQGTNEGPVLGVGVALPTQMQEVLSGVLCEVALTKDKSFKYHSSLSQAVATDSLGSGAASKTTGQMEFGFSCTFDRSARPFLWPLRERAESTSATSLTPALRFSLKALRCLVLNNRPRVIRDKSVIRQHFVGFCDARGRSSAFGNEQVGVLLMGAGHAWFSVLELESSPVQAFLGQKKQRINESEAFGAAVLLYTFATIIRGALQLLQYTLPFLILAAQWFAFFS